MRAEKQRGKAAADAAFEDLKRGGPLDFSWHIGESGSLARDNLEAAQRAKLRLSEIMAKADTAARRHGRPPAMSQPAALPCLHAALI